MARKRNHNPAPRQPQLTLVPEREAAPTGKASTLSVLVTITPHQEEAQQERAPLNLALVIDRSGSMSGQKIAQARAAARYAVEQLLPADRAAVIAFDDQINVLIPSGHPTDKTAWLRAIERLQVGGSTALHGGWRTGADSVAAHRRARYLNRVILITDGQANIGETRVDPIVSEVQQLARQGVGTSTIGIGDDFNEDLLMPMARSGRGNGWHVAEAGDFMRIFQAEFGGLMATVGEEVTLQLRPLQPWVTVRDVLNDFDRDGQGAYHLPDLQSGHPLQIVLDLGIEAGDACSVTPVLEAELSWKVPGAEERPTNSGNRAHFVEVLGEGRRSVTSRLSLALVAEATLSEFPASDEVLTQRQILVAARARQEAVRMMDRGDISGADQLLQRSTSQFLAMCAAPPAPGSALFDEVAELDGLRSDLQSGDIRRARKKSLYQSQYKQTTRSPEPGER